MRSISPRRCASQRRIAGVGQALHCRQYADRGTDFDEELHEKDDSNQPPEDGGRNPTAQSKGEPHSIDIHHSTTDLDARLYKKYDGDRSPLCYIGHELMGNRNDLVVDVQIKYASGAEEREAVLAMT